LLLLLLLLLLLQVVLPEASAAAGHTLDRIVTIMDAAGLSLSALTGFAQRVSTSGCSNAYSSAARMVAGKVHYICVQLRTKKQQHTRLQLSSSTARWLA
jgi:hypothetical protein